jgi:hypothetical protein
VSFSPKTPNIGFKFPSKVKYLSRFVDIFSALWEFPRQQDFRRTKQSIQKLDGNRDVDQVNSERWKPEK